VLFDAVLGEVSKIYYAAAWADHADLLNSGTCLDRAKY
jgi:hypothetical protein